MSKKLLLVLAILSLVISTPFLVSDRSFTASSNTSTEIGGPEPVDDLAPLFPPCSEVTDHWESPCDESRRIPKKVTPVVWEKEKRGEGYVYKGGPCEVTDADDKLHIWTSWEEGTSYWVLIPQGEGAVINSWEQPQGDEYEYSRDRDTETDYVAVQCRDALQDLVNQYPELYPKFRTFYVSPPRPVSGPEAPSVVTGPAR